MKRITLIALMAVVMMAGCNKIDPKKEALKSMTEFVRSTLDKNEQLDEIRLLRIDTVTQKDRAIMEARQYIAIAKKNQLLFELEGNLYQLHKDMLTPGDNSYDIIMQGHVDDMEKYRNKLQSSTESAESLMKDIHKKDSTILDSYYAIFYIAISKNNLQTSDTMPVLMTKNFKIIKNKE